MNSKFAIGALFVTAVVVIALGLGLGLGLKRGHTPPTPPTFPSKPTGVTKEYDDPNNANGQYYFKVNKTSTDPAGFASINDNNKETKNTTFKLDPTTATIGLMLNYSFVADDSTNTFANALAVDNIGNDANNPNDKYNIDQDLEDTGINLRMQENTPSATNHAFYLFNASLDKNLQLFSGKYVVSEGAVIKNKLQTNSTTYDYRLSFKTQILGSAVSNEDYGSRMQVGNKWTTIVLYLKNNAFNLFSLPKSKHSSMLTSYVNDDPSPNPKNFYRSWGFDGKDFSYSNDVSLTNIKGLFDPNNKTISEAIAVTADKTNNDVIVLPKVFDGKDGNYDTFNFSDVQKLEPSQTIGGLTAFKNMSHPWIGDSTNPNSSFFDDKAVFTQYFAFRITTNENGDLWAYGFAADHIIVNTTTGPDSDKNPATSITFG